MSHQPQLQLRSDLWRTKFKLGDLWLTACISPPHRISDSTDSAAMSFSGARTISISHPAPTNRQMVPGAWALRDQLGLTQKKRNKKKKKPTWSSSTRLLSLSHCSVRSSQVCILQNPGSSSRSHWFLMILRKDLAFRTENIGEKPGFLFATFWVSILQLLIYIYIYINNQSTSLLVSMDDPKAKRDPLIYSCSFSGVHFVSLFCPASV